MFDDGQRARTAHGVAQALVGDAASMPVIATWRDVDGASVATVVTGKVAGGGKASWVLLAYRVPREPSTPRIAVWRRLKRLGAAQLLDGLVVLSFDVWNKE